MGRSRRGLASRPVLLFVLCFLFITIFVKHASAQGNEDPAPTDEPADGDTEDTAAAPEPTDEPSATDEEPTAEPTAEPTDDPEDDEESDGAPEDLPTLTGAVRVPTPAVPPKEGAPYLKQSDLPEGTIFIAVGAFLGLLALAVIAWRVLVAWMINRSVRRTTYDNQQPDAAALLQKAPRKGKGKGKGKHSRKSAGASVSMEKLGNNNRHSGLPPRNHNPNSGLFFSPTAGAGMGAGNRGSNYLPSGYYASSNASLGGGAGLAHNNGPGVGLSHLRPQSQGYSRTRSMGPSPPGSPGLPPSNRDDAPPQQSTSSVNLTSPPQGRAPSAYLEDLFENHPPGR